MIEIPEWAGEIVAGQPYPMIFATVSGAHLYGFASVDSDLDLRGAHLLPVAEVVGLRTGPATLQADGVRDGVELDVVSHDLLKFAQLLNTRNGYVLEQLLSPLVVRTSPCPAGSRRRPAARRAGTRRRAVPAARTRRPGCPRSPAQPGGHHPPGDTNCRCDRRRNLTLDMTATSPISATATIVPCSSPRCR